MKRIIYILALLILSNMQLSAQSPIRLIPAGVLGERFPVFEQVRNYPDYRHPDPNFVHYVVNYFMERDDVVPDPYPAFYWNPDGTQFISYVCITRYCGGIPDFALFDGVTDHLIFKLEGSQTVEERLDFRWNRSGTLLTDGYRVWDAQTGELISQRRDQDYSFITKPFWLVDEQTIIAFEEKYFDVEQESYLISWDAFSGETNYVIRLGMIVTFIGENGERIILTTPNGYRLEIDLATGRFVSAERMTQSIQTVALAWSPDSLSIAAAGSGYGRYPIQLWDIENPRVPVWTVNDDWLTIMVENERYYPSGSRLRWDTQSGGIIATTFFPYVIRNASLIDRFDPLDGSSERHYWDESNFQSAVGILSPDMELIAEYTPMAALEPSRCVDILEASTNTLIKSLCLSEVSYGDMAWSPDGSMVAVISDYPLQKTFIWDVVNSTLVNGQIDFIGDELIWSPNGRWLLIRAWETITIVDPLTGQIAMHKESPPIENSTGNSSNPQFAAWNLDSRYVAIAAFHSLSIWDVATDTIITEIETNLSPSAIAWSPDGTTIAVSERQGGIHLFRVE